VWELKGMEAADARQGGLAGGAPDVQLWRAN
jgi:hypothetical protein